MNYRTLPGAIAALSLLAACQTTPNAEAAAPQAAPEPAAVEQERMAQAEQEAPASQPTSQPTTQPADEQGSAHFGAPFAIDGEPMALRAALDNCAGTGEPCKVEGTIDRVCQARGCWFTMAGANVPETVRIRMVDYGFFVPRDAMGQHVVFEGTLEREEIDQATAQHYADDEAAAGTAPPRVVEGPEMTYQFMITGARIDRE